MIEKFLQLIGSIKEAISSEIIEDEKAVRAQRLQRIRERFMAMRQLPSTLPKSYAYGMTIRRLCEQDRYVNYIAAQVAIGRGDISFDDGKIIFHLQLTREDITKINGWSAVGMDEVWIAFRPPKELTDPYCGVGGMS